MSKISVSQTFKRGIFSMVTIFAVAVISITLLDLFMTEQAANITGMALAISAGIYSYIKFPIWFKGRQ